MPQKVRHYLGLFYALYNTNEFNFNKKNSILG
jgi:hypothetical protein